MYCKICGTEKELRYYVSKRQTLCIYCAKDTPTKVSYEQFNKVYFKGDEDCPALIRKEFYDDYLTSNHDLVDYIKATVESI